MKVKDILPKNSIDIMVRTNPPKNCIYEDLLLGYCKWDGEKLISLDGDSYSIEDEILKYEYENDGSLTYWIISEWV